MLENSLMMSQNLSEEEGLGFFPLAQFPVPCPENSVWSLQALSFHWLRARQWGSHPESTWGLQSFVLAWFVIFIFHSENKSGKKKVIHKTFSPDIFMQIRMYTDHKGLPMRRALHFWACGRDTDLALKSLLAELVSIKNSFEQFPFHPVFTEHLLWPRVLLHPWGTSMNKNLCSHGAYILEEKEDN